MLLHVRRWYFSQMRLPTSLPSAKGKMGKVLSIVTFIATKNVLKI